MDYQIRLFPRSITIVVELSILQCKKYRVDQKILISKYLGFNVKIFVWSDSKEVCNFLQYSGTAIFYRVLVFDIVKQEDALARHLGVTTYFDVDDLIFDREKLTQNKSLHHLPEGEPEQLYKNAYLYCEALLLADYGIASTKCLADQMHLVTQKIVFVLHNAIDDKFLNVTKPNSYTSSRCRVVYSSATNTHNEDFAILSEAVIRLFSKYDNLRLSIVGFMEIKGKLRGYLNRIEFVTF